VYPDVDGALLLPLLLAVNVNVNVTAFMYHAGLITQL